MPTSIPTVGILIFPDVEVLDFAGPFEVFSLARPVGTHDDAQRLFQPLTIGTTDGIIRCRGGLQVQPDATIMAHPQLDLLIIPGGHGTIPLLDQPQVLAWIAAQAAANEITASVCTGAFLLAKIGKLDGKAATTHWGSIAALREHFPAIQVQADERYVDTGHIVTSAGVSAGIDMSLHLVARLHGDAVAAWTARQMEYTGSHHDTAVHAG